MKATINGVTYEGTPEEISAMMLIQYAQSRNKPFKQPQGLWGLGEALRAIEECDKQSKYTESIITTSNIADYSITTDRLSGGLIQK